MFDETIRVPLLIRMPGNKSTHTVENSVYTVDLFSTILEFAGACSPPKAEGRSLVPDIKGSPTLGFDVFIEYKDDCIIRGNPKLVTKRKRYSPLLRYGERPV